MEPFHEQRIADLRKQLDEAKTGYNYFVFVRPEDLEYLLNRLEAAERAAKAGAEKLAQAKSLAAAEDERELYELD